jgi:heme/copper-type cytochrome/quinol oxidase subunit 1
VVTVTLTLSAAYMASLGVGVHHFYVTGVNKRGLSAYAESVLTVS